MEMEDEPGRTEQGGIPRGEIAIESVPGRRDVTVHEVQAEQVQQDEEQRHQQPIVIATITAMPPRRHRPNPTAQPHKRTHPKAETKIKQQSRAKLSS